MNTEECLEYEENKGLMERIEAADRRVRSCDVEVKIIYLLSIVIAVGTIAIMIYRALTFDTRAAAAYNEGYYGVDSATAAEMAEAGFGIVNNVVK